MCFFCTCRTPRQKRSAILFFIEAAVQSVNLLFYLVPNAYILTNTCLQQVPLVFWSGWVRWTCWNTVSLTIAAQCLLAASHVAKAIVTSCCVSTVLTHHECLHMLSCLVCHLPLHSCIVMHERLLWLFVCCFLCCNAVLCCCLCQSSRSDKQHEFCLLTPFLLFAAVAFMLLSYVQKRALSTDLSNICYSSPAPYLPIYRCQAEPSSALSKYGSACIPRCCMPLCSCPRCSLCALHSTASRVCVCPQLFMLFLMHAYGGRLRPSKRQQLQQEQGQQSVAESMLYMDVPWRRHWPCLVPWLILESALSVAWLHNAVRESLNLSALLAVTRRIDDGSLASCEWVMHHGPSRSPSFVCCPCWSGLAFGLAWQRSTEGSCMALVLTQLGWQQPCVNTSMPELKQ